MAESPELSQYVTIDLDAERLGRVYDSFLEAHANPGESPIIARSFTEFNRQLETGGACWYWTAPGFESPGDAYADAIQ